MRVGIESETDGISSHVLYTKPVHVPNNRSIFYHVYAAYFVQICLRDNSSITKIISVFDLILLLQSHETFIIKIFFFRLPFYKINQISTIKILSGD